MKTIRKMLRLPEPLWLKLKDAAAQNNRSMVGQLEYLLHGGVTRVTGTRGRHNPLGKEIIKAFEEVDPKNKTYYSNTTQRKACDFLIETYGLQEVLKRVSVLSRTNKLPYFPRIHSPYDLKEKWEKLQDTVDAKRAEVKSKAPIII